MSTRLPDGRAECTHQPESHVAWDKRGWRALVYCRCRRVQVRGKRLYATVGDAEDAGRALLRLTMLTVDGAL